MNRNTKLVVLSLAALLCGATAFSKQAACGTCARPGSSSEPVSLSGTERSALILQVEEERMARELYVQLGSKWDLKPFRMIANSETRHETALRALASRADVELPPAVAGKFTVPQIQERYDSLLALGLESESGALRVGAMVEEQDITDLRNLAAVSESAAMRRTIAALEQASGHHLSAFVRNLSARGVEYTPKVVVAADNSDRMHGRRGMGCGNGNGCGQRQGRGRI